MRNRTNSCLLVLLFVSLWVSGLGFGQPKPSGLADLDTIRAEVAASPTTEANAKQRLALLYSWYRLLQNQGYDIASFEPLSQQLRGGPVPAVVDEGYRALEAVQAGDPLVAVQGFTSTPAEALLDWPSYHGDLGQTGSTKEAGPTEGALAWRFSLGWAWYGRPTIEAGKVYIASPGRTTALYCLDEATGELRWKARQWGISGWDPPPADSPVTILADEVMVRATASQGEVAQLVFVDKATGAVKRRVSPGPTEPRWEPAAEPTGDDFLTYLTDDSTTVTVKLAKSGRTWWRFRVGRAIGEPLLVGDRVYVGTTEGKLWALNLTTPSRVAWVYEAGAPLAGTPALSGDRMLIGANDGSVHCVEASTGQRLWRSEVAKPEHRAQQLFSSPTITGDRVYLAAADSQLYCLDLATGIVRWRFPLGDWGRARPLVLGDIVYTAALDGTVTAIRDAGDYPELLWTRTLDRTKLLADLTGSERGLLIATSDLYLYSLSPATGEIQWRRSLLESIEVDGDRVLADAAPEIFQSSPTVVDGLVCIGGPSGFVHCVRAATGEEVWRFETGGKVSATPTVGAGRVYVGQFGGDEDFYCLDAATGEPLWTRPVGWVWTAAGFDEGRLYVGTTEGDFLCLEAATGRELWRYTTGGGIYPSPAFDEERVYTGSWDGLYYAFNKRTGKLEWTYSRPGLPYHIGGRPDSACPVIAGDLLLVQTQGALLVALEAATGRERWQWAVPEWRLQNGTPAYSGGVVYASCFTDAYTCPGGAQLFALEASTGKQLWAYPDGGGITAPSVAGERLYFASTGSAWFTCLNTKEPAQPSLVWRYKLGGPVMESTPALYGRLVFIADSAGWLWALR